MQNATMKPKPSVPLENVNVVGLEPMLTPAEVHARVPLTPPAAATVARGREALRAILERRDPRIFVVVGPCSIHDPAAALDYAQRLGKLATEVAGTMLIVMRVYFEKPRTSTGWKGFINDPRLDDSFHIEEGITAARRLLVTIAELGLPTGSEALDPMSPQYLADLISWYAIGARTTESQIHRELASGLSCPVGFKNGTDGSIRIAVDAIRAAQAPHHFLSVTKGGHSAIVSTTGNEDCHVILRGGNSPNYDAASVAAAAKGLAGAGAPARLMIDFSHGNSSKQPQKQIDVGQDVSRQIAGGEDRIFGIMVESHLKAGRQDLIPGKPLVYGQSITDGSIGWEDSRKLLDALAEAVRKRRVRAEVEAQ